MTLLHQLMVAERQRELRAAARELCRTEARPRRRWAWRSAGADVPGPRTLLANWGTFVARLGR